MAKDFNETLNLPKTDFPMRAGLPAPACPPASRRCSSAGTRWTFTASF